MPSCPAPSIRAAARSRSTPKRCVMKTCSCSSDAELDQSIEVARAQQEVQLSTWTMCCPPSMRSSARMLGWRTIQPGLNPLRPEVFVRALQSTLALEHVPQAPVREAMIAPAAGLLGVNLRKLYRELSDWLASTGVEPAVPVGGQDAARQLAPAAPWWPTRWPKRCSRWTGCASCWPAISIPPRCAARGLPAHRAGVHGGAAGPQAGGCAGASGWSSAPPRRRPWPTAACRCARKPLRHPAPGPPAGRRSGAPDVRQPGRRTRACWPR
jgi:hypothetical protein